MSRVVTVKRDLVCIFIHGASGVFANVHGEEWKEECIAPVGAEVEERQAMAMNQEERRLVWEAHAFELGPRSGELPNENHPRISITYI